MDNIVILLQKELKIYKINLCVLYVTYLLMTHKSVKNVEF